jgi:hypothetical protein
MTAPSADGPWSLKVDRRGTVDSAGEAALVDHVRTSGVTDLVVFSHGWNNDEQAATSLYARWYELLCAQLASAGAVGFVGIRWPSQLWRDEPIPTYPGPGRPPGDAGTAAGGGGGRSTVPAGPPSLTEDELRDLKDVFPGTDDELDAIAGLLAADSEQASAGDLFAALKAFADKDPEGFNDGETPDTSEPGMLEGASANELFDAFALHLSQSGVEFAAVGDGGAGAQARAVAGRRRQSAKEVLRQISYWKMKKRAGVVGRHGVGPLISRLSTEFPGLRVHLVGHSFGARVVSFALAGVAQTEPPSRPIKSVTLLQGAFSRFAFADELPFNAGRRNAAGALAGTLARIDGPLTVCFSSHDGALSTFYPLAAMAALDWAAGAGFDLMRRWRAMGHLGAYDQSAPAVQLGAVGQLYSFAPGAVLNVDASDVVFRGDPPFGAHSDIFHPQLAWLVAAAAGVNRQQPPTTDVDPS